jgi:hypothetical protein
MMFRSGYIINSIMSAIHSTNTDILYSTATMDVSENRLFRWGKPEWLNNSTIRNTGVYTSGALARHHPPVSLQCRTNPASSR